MTTSGWSGTTAAATARTRTSTARRRASTATSTTWSTCSTAGGPSSPGTRSAVSSRSVPRCARRSSSTGRRVRDNIAWSPGWDDSVMQRIFAADDPAEAAARMLLGEDRFVGLDGADRAAPASRRAHVRRRGAVRAHRDPALRRGGAAGTAGLRPEQRARHAGRGRLPGAEVARGRRRPPRRRPQCAPHRPSGLRRASSSGHTSSPPHPRSCNDHRVLAVAGGDPRRATRTVPRAPGCRSGAAVRRGDEGPEPGATGRDRGAAGRDRHPDLGGAAGRVRRADPRGRAVVDDRRRAR